ncbi:hypothetical protein JX265_011525 [Neoarthrinium moseri]|uniref:Uncharacterized protein n=1 Tax=Neoarthrinium moseri TaxID=1658444 RepID=A0A9P9WCE5_9PEZI|nr:uncharacterized protein JN550_011725 [Neoarthrinium moseri]KAI1856566.1 hypothetical protein JX265_011525 [Neoarthrinium moseri]KAI1860041.1 hypothetical protein JN550_011725 [Neoarthrinium moseri]
MNYANMIEEKNLKKTFIIATLCSTLVGTFTSSIGLWDRVADKRKQKKRDTKQDGEIAQLKSQIEQAEKRSKEAEDRMRDRDRGTDDVGYALQRSGAAISKEFDDGYARLGRRFAVGDAATENKLQAQVIALQQTVINVLQDALYSGRQLDRVDMAKLIAASNAARDGSLDALRQQRDRQLLALEAPPPPQALLPPKRSSTVLETEPLYCRYALDLQYIRNKPLAANFAPGGSCRCPDCGVRLDVESDDFWVIDKRAPRLIADGRYEREVIEEREFHLGQRFVVKCHTPDGEYACVICSRHRERDAICPSVSSLINHVGRFHDMKELESEVDIEPRSKASPGARLLALPAPPPKQRALEYNPPVRQQDDFDYKSNSGGGIASARASNYS